MPGLDARYSPPPTVTINSGRINIHTAKVARIYEEVTTTSFHKFATDMKNTADLPGPRVVLIDSYGGDVEVGKRMLSMLKLEQLSGTTIVCYVVRSASSMAFNILSNCDVRLASPDASSVVHKMRFTFREGTTRTAKQLREEADELEKDDKPFCLLNALTMGLSPWEYDFFADRETAWSASQLLKRNYYQALIPRSEVFK